MIPVRLEMRDFLSYAQPDPLDFTPFDVACLSGDNGVGKSALLDAMTWSLFGRARGCESGQNQDRLIRDGRTEAVVDFTFSLGGARYRIVRRRMRTPRGESKGDVRFLVSDGDGEWKNIAGENLKATDEKIASTLRMDYETFTASAFFLQGRSEDFLARMSPTDRKEVFARLLDLGVYEDLEEAARDRARSSERSRLDVAARIGELESSSVDVPALERELDDVTARAAQLEADDAAATTELTAARHEQGEIEKQQIHLDRERQARDANRTAHDEATAYARAKQQELADVDALLARSDEARTAVAELDELRTADEAARAQQEEAAALERKAAQLTAAIEAEGRTIADRIAARRNRIATLERELGPLRDATTQLQAVDAELDASADPATGLADAREQLESHQTGAARCEEQARAADELIAKTQSALEVLGGGGAGGVSPQAECPVCGHVLDAKHRAEAKRRLTSDVRTAKADQQSARAGVATARKEAKRIAEDIRRLEAARVARERLASTRAELLARLERLEPVSSELDELRAVAGPDEAALADASFAAEARRELADVEARAASAYDGLAHRRILERLKELAPAATLLGAIEEAGRRRTQVAADLDAAGERLAQLGAEHEELERTIAALTGLTKALPAAAEQVRTCEDRLSALQVQAKELSAQHARVQERLEIARRVERELDAARSQERVLGAETRRYRRLVEAFGRGGIPDRVIDNALPELTEDANRILGRLSDHEMSVSFQLQRDTRSGKAKETFEALVHHDGGVRDFAMFSGGEAFRVAFAVRLAMSKLLVARAGARLETLVIDEGFATQDPHGRERLVEAINVARTEFAKILVITHLEDLKDQFGAQIVVSKGREGSILNVTGT